jgi:pyruvate formate lyase activating enzyme
LRYVYVGNVRGVPEVQDTFCPQCKKPVVRRDIFAVTAMDIQAGKCKLCQTAIPGVWSL